MRNLLRCCLLGGIITLLSTGVSFAHTISWDFAFDFLNTDGSTGAVVHLDIVDPGGMITTDPFYSATDYTYIYAVENTGFDPDSDNGPGIYAPIHSFSLPVVGSSVTDYGTFGPVDAGNVTLYSVFDLLTVSWPLPVPGSPLHEITFGNTSDPFFFQSTYEPFEVTATMRNDSESIDQVVYSAIVEPEPVPEPSTLLLLGTGVLGLFGYACLIS